MISFMVKQLRPISDLQRVLRFDDYDLTANRSGLMSIRQRWNFIRARLLEHFLGALTVSYVVAWAINALNLAPNADMILIGGAVLLGITAVLFAIRIRPAFAKSVTAVRGKLAIRDVIPLNGLALEEVAIASMPFFLRYHVFDILDDGATYNAYYLKRDLKVGGNQLLSLEFIAPAPDEDDEEYVE